MFYPLDPEHFIPAGGQGILAVEVKEGSPAARLCEKIDVPNAHICLNAERGVLGLLKCRLPRTYWRIRPDRRKINSFFRLQGLFPAHLVME